MKKYILLTFNFFLFLPFLSAQLLNYADHVNPMIGTGGHGHTFPGATVPFGMVQLSPDTRVDGSWDGCSGYHYSDSVIYGFSHTHLSGTGCSDYGDIMIMPAMKEILDWDKKTYCSKFSHSTEKASVGYYKVKLEDDNIDVELTATTRVGFHKYTFNKDGDATIILDLEHRDKLIDGHVKIINSRTIEVFRRSEAWAKDQYIFARIEFSKDFYEAGESNKENPSEPGTFSDACQGYGFKVKKGESIYIKVAISPVSTEGAKKNMEAELPGWDFEKTKMAARKLWNDELRKIEITSNSLDKLKIFYTALYHTMIQPNVAMDVDSMYRGRDNKIHKAKGFTYYSVFSLWDTFRAAHPLYTIIDQKRTSDFINTFLAQYEQGGRLPVWELASNETDCMIGYHSVSVISDAMVKGIKGFDYEKAFVAAKHSAMLDHLGLKAYKQNGFISMEDEHESVSKTLEYAYDDWCIAQMALVLNKQVDYEYFMKRSQNWKNVFDPETGFMRPKKNGGWLSPFEPREVNNNFTEGNSWQYTFFVPQDINGLIDMMGGPQKFEKKLDELFSTSSQTTGREQADITGLIGQYAHGNEPSHHMAYLYNYIQIPSKAEARIHQILTEFYKPSPDGLIGNEDCGQMSAWYVMSSMGIYQVTPGSIKFQIGAPLFESVKINLENGKTFSVFTKDFSDKNYFVKSVKSEGMLLPKGDIFSSITDGRNLNFEMSPIANDKWIENASPRFYSPPTWYEKIVTVPVIVAPARVFDDSMKVEIKGNGKLFYSAENVNLSKRLFKEYAGPFYIQTSKDIFVYADDGTKKSDTISGSFYKRPNHWQLHLSSTYNPQYTAGGDEGLIDGLRGDVNWRKGEWQGYQYQDFEAVIDLGTLQKISEFNSGFLQDSRSWILFPSKVEYYVSEDGKKYTLAGTVDSGVKWDDYETKVFEFSVKRDPIKARYVQIKASNFGKLPKGHVGEGDGAFIFIDEISLK